MDFTGKKALVTGSGGGIGKSIALLLADMGADIVVNDVSIDNAQQTAKEVISKGRKAIVSNANVVNDTQVREMFESIASEFGRIDILVNNAGITRDGTLHRMDFEAWNAVVQTNLSSCFNMCRLVIDGMRARSFGRIINIGSINGQAGQYGQVNYAAAKSGIHGFTKALAQEGAAKNVTVNAIAPGYVDTDMVRAVPEEVLKKIIAGIPVGRLGQASDIARGVMFLAADDAGFVTGSTMSINGGQHMY